MASVDRYLCGFLSHFAPILETHPIIMRVILIIFFWRNFQKKNSDTLTILFINILDSLYEQNRDVTGDPLGSNRNYLFVKAFYSKNKNLLLSGEKQIEVQ